MMNSTQVAYKGIHPACTLPSNSLPMKSFGHSTWMIVPFPSQPVQHWSKDSPCSQSSNVLWPQGAHQKKWQALKNWMHLFPPPYLQWWSMLTNGVDSHWLLYQDPSALSTSTCATTKLWESESTRTAREDAKYNALPQTTQQIDVADDYVTFCYKFKYLGSPISVTVTTLKPKSLLHLKAWALLRTSGTTHTWTHIASIFCFTWSLSTFSFGGVMVAQTSPSPQTWSVSTPQHTTNTPYLHIRCWRMSHLQ